MSRGRRDAHCSGCATDVGKRALGLDEASLASFPDEFKQGVAGRAETLGDTGLNAPKRWVGGLASPDLQAIVILFARDPGEHDRCVPEHEKLIAGCPGVDVLPVLDLQAIPPFGYGHEHFGYRAIYATSASPR